MVNIISKNMLFKYIEGAIMPPIKLKESANGRQIIKYDPGIRAATC